MFEFAQLLSTVAKGQAKPFSGLPEFHFVGGNIDEATVPSNALTEAVGIRLRKPKSRSVNSLPLSVR
ncbi:MAG: hypothetical protein O3C11_07735, partial [Proteobacteria bacterium]|nr:hypothetical protein [Pseudomonadota bacterium]